MAVIIKYTGNVTFGNMLDSGVCRYGTGFALGDENAL